MSAGSPAELFVLSMGLAALLGGSFIWLSLKGKESSLSLRITLLQLGLLFSVNCLIFTLYVIQSSSLSDKFSVELLNALEGASSTLNLFTVVQISVILLIFPAPIFITRKKLALSFVVLLSIPIIVMLFNSFVSVYWFASGWVMTQGILIGLVALVPLRWYLLYRDSDDVKLRNQAIAAALMLLALYGGNMTKWPIILNLGGTDLMFQGITGLAIDKSLMILMITHAGQLVCIVGLFAIIWKEIMAESEKRDKAMTTIIFAYLIYGLVNLVVIKISPNGTQFRQVWDFFALVGMFGLIRPILIIYIALRFNLFDMSNPKTRGRIRIIALLIATVWTSSLFEIVQAFLPMPQLISAAMIGVMLAFVIGWEDTIFENLSSGSDEVKLYLADDLFVEEDLFRLTMSTICIVVITTLIGLALGGGGILL
tara:strand:- start:728 stop:2002 length:1275 start_codon:yes stop_codon:yes gene_type:complete